VAVRTSAGRIVKHLVSKSMEAGGQSVRWNVRNDGGRIVRDGRYVVRVRASNAIGSVALAKPVTVRRRF
jgi:flagellar hook assembly protein FlgD